MVKRLFFIILISVPVCALGQDIDAGFNIGVNEDNSRDWGWYGSDGDYYIDSPLYALGPKRYSTYNPLMKLSRDQSGYYFAVILPLNDADECDKFSKYGVLRHISLYTSDGDSVTMSYGFINIYTWIPEHRGLTGMIGIRNYRMMLTFSVDDINEFLNRTYVGYNISSGYCADNFSNKPSRVKSFNKSLHTARRILDKRVRRASKRGSAILGNPDL